MSTHPGYGGGGTDLTPRMIEELQMAAAGHTARSAASVRGVSFDTVKHQRWFAIRRLGADNLPHAIAICFRRGILR